MPVKVPAEEASPDSIAPFRYLDTPLGERLCMRVLAAFRFHAYVHAVRQGIAETIVMGAIDTTIR